MSSAIVGVVACSLAIAGLVWAVRAAQLPPADFRFVNGDEIKTVDPARVTGSLEGRIIRGLFEGLVNWHPETLEATPGVAYEWSEDQRVHTFRLRPDALWSDGSPVTAHDFVYSFRRFLHPATGAEYAYEMWYVVGAEDYTRARVEPGDPVEIEFFEQEPAALPFAPGRMIRGRAIAAFRAEWASPAAEARAGENAEPPIVAIVEIDGRRRAFLPVSSPDRATDFISRRTEFPLEPCRWLLPDFEATVAIDAVDDHTLRIELTHPVPYFVQLMGFYPMYPVQRRCVETHGDPLWTKPENIVSNGPFRLEARRIRDRIRMVKSETYWNRDRVYLRSVEALPVKSDTTALNLYLTGQVDYIVQVPPTIVPELLAREDFRPVPYLNTYYFRLNTRHKPLDDVRVRRALALALDREEIVRRVTRAGQIAADSFVPREMSRHVPYESPSLGRHDAQQARRLLAAAGFADGRGFPRLEVLYNTSESHQAIAELIQSQWRRHLGIEVRLQNVEWSTYLQRQQDGDYQIARAGWIADYADPGTYLKMYVTDGANNQTGWGSAEYDRLVDEAQREADIARRMRLFRQAEEILLAEMPVIPVYYAVTMSMVRPYVRGFSPNALDVHPYQGVSIDRPMKRALLEREGLP